jgi:S-adenosylmethionine:tRNA ribosyltransferase-isomerase
MNEENFFQLANFQYNLPQSLIAQYPLEKRDSSRLLVVDRKSKTFKEIIFSEVIDLLKPRDLLVLNNTRVIKARLYGQKNQRRKT